MASKKGIHFFTDCISPNLGSSTFGGICLNQEGTNFLEGSGGRTI